MATKESEYEMKVGLLAELPALRNACANLINVDAGFVHRFGTIRHLRLAN